ncbi:MAG: hypothetical protein KAI66_17125 [Lentisphaeria bacterium]|nr:hypothetical protein [Lentisphaeria bacterium]
MTTRTRVMVWLCVGATALFWCPGALSQEMPASSARVPVDDLESFKAYEKWAVSGGPEASVMQSTNVHRSGGHSVRLRVKVDFQTAGNPKYPKGWLFLNRNFESPQDWSEYKGLEFFLFVPADHPMRGKLLQYGIATEGIGAAFRWKTLSAAAVRPGAWTRIVVPLAGLNVRGDLGRVMQIRFHVAENWYLEGDELNFYFDDFTLLKELTREDGSEWIRPAGKALNTPASYLKQGTPAVYPVLPLEFIYPDTDLSGRKPVEAFDLRAAQGEMKALTFAVLAGATGIGDLSVSMADLRGPDGASIPRGAFDVRVVKVWEQAALHWEVLSPEDKILVPELLLKDDRIEFDESRGGDQQYHAPSVLNIPFGTDVPAHTVKQIWLNIDVPPDAPSGSYAGTMTLGARAGLGSLRIPVKLRVLPFCLPAPKPTYGIYYRWRPAPTGRFSIPDKRFMADLRELKKAGFDALTCYDPEHLEHVLAAMKQTGMTGPIVVMNVREEKTARMALEACQSHGIECFFYGVDEPNDEKRTERHKKLSTLLHGVGGKAMTAIVPDTAKKLLQLGEGLDWANHAVPNAAAFIRDLRRGKEAKTAPFETYYWQVYEENPTRNRMFCGFYLWWSGLEGAFPYEYQAPIGLPYTHDTRSSMKRVKKGGKTRTFRAWCVTYPGSEGPVSTLQWEGCRIGVNDVRYLTLLESLIGKLERRGRKAEAEGLRTRMDKIVAACARLPADPSVYTNPYVEPVKLEAARQQITDLILDAKRAL